ncbi:MAG: riboflavin synthase [Nitrospirota bacterium]
MFTGIIEELGTVKSVVKGKDSARVKVLAPEISGGLSIGDSVAVNGVCLTVVELPEKSFSADVMAETLRMTNIGVLRPGDRVNLERPLRPSDRMGGHMVSGHIDGKGVIKSVVREDIASVFTISAPECVMRYIISKGSIAIDGISLTVVDFGGDSFRVSIIPHTLKLTTLGIKNAGDTVNLESDLVAKYIERLLPGAGEGGGDKGGLSRGFLAGHGFI